MYVLPYMTVFGKNMYKMYKKYHHSLTVDCCILEIVLKKSCIFIQRNIKAEMHHLGLMWREVYSKDVGGVVWKPAIIFNQALQNLENDLLLEITHVSV